MALAEILEIYDPPLKEIRMAFKMFNLLRNDQLQFPHFGLDGRYMDADHGRYVPVRQWLSARRRETLLIDGSKYLSGFHVCPTREELELWCKPVWNRVILPVLVSRVRMRATHTPEGLHDSAVRLPVLIADRMYVPDTGHTQLRCSCRPQRRAAAGLLIGFDADCPLHGAGTY